MALKLKFEKVIAKDNTNRTTKAESDILQQAQLIMARVTKETFNALSNTVASHELSLSLQADELALKVSSEDFNGETIASLINVSSSAVKIKAKNIEFEGLITANSNFKILADGSIEAVNAKLSGDISATRMVAVSKPYSYAEIGQSSGLNNGIGLFDTRYGVEAFCEILESSDFQGFLMRDRNNINRFIVTQENTALKDSNDFYRFLAAPTYTTLRDYDNAPILVSIGGTRTMYSPDQKNYIVINNDTIQIVKNGVVKASW